MSRARPGPVHFILLLALFAPACGGCDDGDDATSNPRPPPSNVAAGPVRSAVQMSKGFRSKPPWQTTAVTEDASAEELAP